VIGLLHDASRDKATDSGDSAEALDGKAASQLWWRAAINRTKKS
jgi:hypothetical protein